jgi:biopolymer transport protein ExbD
MSFSRPEQPQRRAMPLTALIDVMFILIIFFVVTTSFRQEERQIDVNLVAAESGVITEPSRTELVINVKEDGAIMLGYRQLQPAELLATLRDLVSAYPGERVIVRGDKNASYERVLAVVDAARAAGVRSVNLATVHKAEEAGGG